MVLNWLSDFAEAWLNRGKSERVPHAVLLAGPPGTGKRAAAAWIARHKLGIAGEALPVYSAPLPEHPDLRWLNPPPDKQAISIDQVRELVGDLGLTSFSGAGKVAVVDPANTMTVNAANSLLKTLEEPPGDALLVLIADRVGRLPATIFSRCQRIDFAAPDADDALAWLNRLRPGAPWPEALALAGRAPIAAIEALESIKVSRNMAEDFNAVARREASPIDVAARWAKIEPVFVLNWLSQQVKLATVAQLAGRERASGVLIDDSVLRRVDRRNLFCYSDIIDRLRGQLAGSFNVQLTLEGLLIHWMNGLAERLTDTADGGMDLMLAKREAG